MSTASEILEGYARDWEIDQTPVNSLRRSQSSSPELIPAFAAAVSVAEHLPRFLEALLLPRLPDLAETNLLMSEALERLLRGLTSTVRLAGTVPSAAAYWTDAALERNTRVHRELSRLMTKTDASEHSSDAVSLPQSRSERALHAVNDLASWLGKTRPDAAEASGGYRRSYYNWLNGTQPYEATTLNLFETHAFVAALIDAIDIRGAREWLALPLEGRARMEFLGDASGRAKLSDLARNILFESREEGVWSPDDELRHSVPTRSEADQPPRVRSVRKLTPPKTRFSDTAE